MPFIHIDNSVAIEKQRLVHLCKRILFSLHERSCPVVIIRDPNVKKGIIKDHSFQNRGSGFLYQYLLLQGKHVVILKMKSVKFIKVYWEPGITVQYQDIYSSYAF